MTAVKIPARSIIVQVLAADNVTWLPISSLSEVTVDRSANAAVADVTTFDSNGSYEARAMQRGAQLDLSGYLVKDDTTGVQDTGQARCVTLAKATGEASLGQIRYRHPADSLWQVWTAVFEEQKFGGKTNDESAWGMKVTRSGAATTATAP
jgi:hypothetical protein